MLGLMRAAFWLLAVAVPLCQAQTAAPPAPGMSNAWDLANLGDIKGPPPNSVFVQQRAQLLARGGAAARAVVQGTTQSANKTLLSGLTSFVATSPGNAAAPGATNARGLLLYTPRNSTLDAVDFQNFFAAAYSNASVTGIALGTGRGVTTYFVNNQEPNFHINLYCFNRPGNAPFELDFTNNTIFFGNYQLGGIGFFFCQNFNFHGPFNFMYTSAALPFSQGTITAYTVAGDTATYTVQTDQGYPTTTTGLGDGNPHLSVQYHPNGTIVQNSSDIYSNPATVLNAATGLYSFTAPPTNNVRVGNKLAIRGNAGNHGVLIYKGVNFRLQYMFQYTAPIFGVLDVLSTGSIISNNIIQPWPYLIGSTKPLLSTNADGIHAASPYKVGPTIVSNQILSPGDDGIANHGIFYTVYSVDPSTPNSLIVFSPTCNNDFCASFFAGDTVKVYSAPYPAGGPTTTAAPDAFTLLGAAALTGVTLLNAAPGGPPGGGSGGPSVYPQVNYNSGYYYRFTFATFPPGFAQASKDALASNTAANGDNFRIQSNVITNHRARSIFNKGSNGLIANNVVQQPTIFGLYMAPDLFFLESDFSQNVTVQNNFFNVTLGPVVQYIQNPADGSLVISQNYRNISYVLNTLENAGTWAAALSSTANLTLISNLVRNAGCFPNVFGLFTPFVPDRTLAYIGQSSNVTLANNKFLTTKGCDATYGNYAAPIYANNVTLTSNF